MRLAIFGGTFNPIHIAHVAVADAAYEHLRLDRLLLVPSATPPHKADAQLAPAAHRLRMAELAAAAREGWEVSAIEVQRGGRSYSIDTVRAVTREYRLQEPPFFLIGADMLQELAAWRSVAQLVELCRFVVAARPGSTLEAPAELSAAIGPTRVQTICERIVPAPMMGVSSKEIRTRVAAGKAIDDLVPAQVAAYIREHGLYL